MKIRFDFVTNSSSSSFVIICREELNQKMLYELFQISDNHPLSDLLKDMADIILNKAEKTTREDIENDLHYYAEKYEKYMDKNFHWYQGCFEDEGFGSEMAESYLCATDLNIDTDDFVMIHEGGY
jgi:hypothetical protein